MSNKSLVSAVAAGIVGLTGGIVGIVSQFNSPSPPPSEKAGAAPPPVVTPADFCQKLQAACAEKDLRGVWVTSAEKKGGKLVLHGVVDQKSQRAVVKDKADELFKLMPSSLKDDCLDGPDANGLTLGNWTYKLKEMQRSWGKPSSDSDDKKQEVLQLRRQTRLDSVYFVHPNKLVFTGVCLAANGNVQGMVEEWLTNYKWGEANAAAQEANTVLAIDTSGIKRLANPTLAIEKAAQQQGKQPSKLNLDWAWYDGEGRLHLDGAAPKESDVEALKDLLTKQFAPQWQTDNIVRADAGKGWTAEGVRVFDVEDLRGPLQAQFAKSDKNLLLNSTRVDKLSFHRHPVYGLRLRFQGLCIPSASKEEAEEQLAERLKKEIEAAIKKFLPDGQGFAVALPPPDTFKPTLLDDLQNKINQAHLRGVLIGRIIFDESGMAVPEGSLSAKPETRKRVNDLLASMLGKPQPKTAPEEEESEPPTPEEQQMEAPAPADTEEEFQGFEDVLPELWKEMARDPKWRYIHIDEVTADGIAEGLKRKTLKFTGVWLHKGSRPTAKEKEDFNLYFMKRAKELEVHNFNPPESMPEKFAPLHLDEVESPLPRLREEVLNNKDLEGFVFLDACFAEDGKLQISGYYKAKDGKEDKEQLSKANGRK